MVTDTADLHASVTKDDFSFIISHGGSLVTNSNYCINHFTSFRRENFYNKQLVDLYIKGNRQSAIRKIKITLEI